MGRLTNSHYNEETSAEAAEVQHGGARALDKVIGVGASRADPVGDRGQHVSGDDEERIVDLPEGAGEDNQEETDGEDEGEGDDGLEPCGRHLGCRSVEECQSGLGFLFRRGIGLELGPRRGFESIFLKRIASRG